MIDTILSNKNQKLLQSMQINSFVAKNILITGASSGIGQSLAIAYAKKGITLFLWGRSESKIKRIVNICEEKGATVHYFIVDLTNSNKVLDLLDNLLKQYKIDMAFFAAGSGDIKNEKEILENSSILFNLMALNYVTPCVMANKIAEQMIKNHITGHLIFIGSVAAFHSLPFATAYSSSKAALTRFADSLRIALKKWHINVTIITPGFIDTPMSQRLECTKPFLVPLDRATQAIIKAVKENKSHLTIPKLFILLKWLELLAPDFIKDFILSHIKVKQH